MKCPLCKKNNLSKINIKHKTYHQCKQCCLIYLDKVHYLSSEQEKQRYDTHENNSEDLGYQSFLRPAFDVLSAYLKKPSLGLDFGCGKDSPLPKMFEAAGHTVRLYDPFYYPGTKVFDQQYDFIVSTETFEHLFDPHKELTLLNNSLKPGAYLTIMTKLFDSRDGFVNSYYHKDPTHVVFYTRKTWEYVCKVFAFELIKLEGDCTVLQKKHI